MSSHIHSVRFRPSARADMRHGVLSSLLRGLLRLIAGRRIKWTAGGSVRSVIAPSIGAPV